MPRTIVPFGPQHPVLPEPIQLQLVLEEEIVREAVPVFGFVHRGLERLVESRDFEQMLYVCERVCGICSTIHGLCYCQCLEGLLDVEVPRRARFLRVVWSELHRMHSHFLWLGLAADALGFESLFMQAMRLRETVMDIMEKTTGNRVIISVNVIGGVRRDLVFGERRWILDQLDTLESEYIPMARIFSSEATIRNRTEGVGILTREQALELGAVGPVARGSGIAEDLRLTRYAAFNELSIEPVVEKAGDALARMKVRVREIPQSMNLIREALSKMPDGEVRTKVVGRPEGEIVGRVEQPRGELMYYILAEGGKNLTRLRIKTPTFSNIPALLAMLPGLDLAQVPVAVLSIDPCMSCTER